jgi:thiamine pyridinylase
VLAVSLATWSCATRAAKPTPEASSVTSLKVALYPYVPRPAQFQAAIASAWQRVQPGVTLTWATDWDGGYDMDPDPSYDVFVFDAINLGYFQAKGYLQPLAISQVPNYGDLVPFAAAGVTIGTQVLGIPQLGCGDFLFYHGNDHALVAATTASQLSATLGTCTFYGETPPNGTTGLMLDFAGGTTDASTYVSSVHERTGAFPVPLPPDPAHIDPTAAATLQGVTALSSFTNALYRNDAAPYQRATWFGQGYGRAYVGFTESMSQLDSATLASIAFKPMPWSDNPTGLRTPLFYSDVVGVNVSTASRGTTTLAIQLANLMTSPSVIVASFGPSGGSGPQYLMPVSKSALKTLAAQFSTYRQMATALQATQPTLFNLGAGSKAWFSSMKSSMRSMMLANPKCYCDVASPPIANNDDAKLKCPPVCTSHGGWNGQWTNVGGGSVCGCNCGSVAYRQRAVSRR